MLVDDKCLYYLLGAKEGQVKRPEACCISIYDFIVGGMSAISECENMSRVPNVISGP